MTNIVDSLNPSGFEPIKPPQPNESGGSRLRLWILRGLVFVLPILILIGAVAAFIIMGAMKSEPEETEEVVKAIPVLTTMATRDNVVLTVDVQGEVQPRTEINLVPQVNGLITYMSPKFIEGGRFNKGDLLVRIDPEEYALRVTQAQANVAQAETVVVRELAEAAIAKQDWEQLGRTGEPTALTLREPQVAEARAQLASAKARLSEAELQLKRTTLVAPFSGRVTIRHVDQGEFVTAGTKLGEIYATSVMDVRLPLTNEELRRAGLTLGFEATDQTPGIPVTLKADVAGTLSEWSGEIVRTDSRFDAATRVLYAYVEVRDPISKGTGPGTLLAPGIFVNAAIDGRRLDNVITVPRSALRGQDQVYVAEDDTLSIKTVSVLSSNRQEAVLADGITPGVQVITSPIRGVAEGMKVEVVNRDAANAPVQTVEGGE